MDSNEFRFWDEPHFWTAEPEVKSTVHDSAGIPHLV